MENLRPIGLHPGALARRQDHGEDRRPLRHVPALLLSFVCPAVLGWGGRIRTCDPGTKTRCLATWPRPSTGSCRLYRSVFSPSGRNLAVTPRPVAGTRPAGMLPDPI